MALMNLSLLQKHTVMILWMVSLKSENTRVKHKILYLNKPET